MISATDLSESLFRPMRPPFPIETKTGPSVICDAASSDLLPIAPAVSRTPTQFVGGLMDRPA
jgi:hypothetical protein